MRLRAIIPTKFQLPKLGRYELCTFQGCDVVTLVVSVGPGASLGHPGSLLTSAPMSEIPANVHHVYIWGYISDIWGL
jgi:hypothetical protein